MTHPRDPNDPHIVDMAQILADQRAVELLSGRSCDPAELDDRTLRILAAWSAEAREAEFALRAPADPQPVNKLSRRQRLNPKLRGTLAGATVTVVLFGLGTGVAAAVAGDPLAGLGGLRSAATVAVHDPASSHDLRLSYLGQQVRKQSRQARQLAARGDVVAAEQTLQKARDAIPRLDPTERSDALTDTDVAAVQVRQASSRATQPTSAADIVARAQPAASAILATRSGLPAAPPASASDSAGQTILAGPIEPTPETSRPPGSRDAQPAPAAATEGNASSTADPTAEKAVTAPAAPAATGTPRAQPSPTSPTTATPAPGRSAPPGRILPGASESSPGASAASSQPRQGEASQRPPRQSQPSQGAPPSRDAAPSPSPTPSTVSTKSPSAPATAAKPRSTRKPTSTAKPNSPAKPTSTAKPAKTAKPGKAPKPTSTAATSSSAASNGSTTSKQSATTSAGSVTVSPPPPPRERVPAN